MKTLSINENLQRKFHFTNSTKTKASFFNKPVFIKLLNWEFWPFHVIYLPIYFYWLYLSIKARSLFFFSAVNPSIRNSGLIGESKKDILDQLPDQYKPKTLKFDANTSACWAWKKIEHNKMNFPLIVKPDIGEKGWGVEKLNSIEELESYFYKNRVDILIQEFVKHPEEYAVMFYKKPGKSKGKVISITKKRFLSIMGDGVSTIEEILKKKKRSRLKLNQLRQKHKKELNTVLEKGAVKLLEPIGNHVRGTKFINANHLINDELDQSFSKITNELDGVNFCRYDLKCKTENDLLTGKNIQVVEINGVGAEPAHIYDPKYKLIDAWKDLINQWNIIYAIAVQNHKNGIPYLSPINAFSEIQRIRKYKHSAKI